jgi:hypothetical protein
VTAATDHAVEGFTAHTRALAIAETVSGLESLEVMELIHHLDLAPDPYLATERETVADWARTHGLDALRQALTAIGAVSTGEGPAEPWNGRGIDPATLPAWERALLAEQQLDPMTEAEYRRAQADFDDGPGHQDYDEDDDQDTEVDA